MKTLNILPFLICVVFFSGVLQAKDFSIPDTVYITHTFSAKEKDSESGYTYFGARYYSDGIMQWLSVDPKSDKYPSTSPYMYCMGNPIKLVDPTGSIVEYNSFADWLFVNIAKIFDKTFRQNFKILKNSNETYVFSKNTTHSNFTTDGDKLYINYDIKSNSEQGTNAFVNLRHETKHGIQFEHGEVGFDNGGRTKPDGTPDWTNSAIFDIYDEIEARDAGYSGFTWNSDPNKNVRNSWLYGENSIEEKIKNLQQNSKNYRNIPVERVNNTNTTKIKNSIQYKLPYVGYGKSHKDICLIKYYDDLLMPPYYKKFFMRNDSIFVYNIYSKYNYSNHSYEDIIDSVKLLDWSFIKVGKNKYIESYIDMGDSVHKLVKFRKKAKTKWLKKNNKWVNADYELKPIFFKYRLKMLFSVPNHETTHAVQFEYGELGFEKIGNEWSAINYDIMDEYEAHYNQNKTFGWNVSGSPSELWINASQEQKIESLQKTYTDLPINSTNNDNKQRIKNGIMYAKPYQPRSHISKMYYTPNLTCIDYIPINVRNLSTRRNDTIFSYNIYYFSGNVDSIVFRGIDVRICKNKWIGYNNDGDYTISSWKKTKPSKTYLQYNDSIFKAECEVISIRWDQYSSTGILKTSKRTFLGIKWYKTY